MESEAHKDLKRKAKKWLKEEHGFDEDSIEEEYHIEKKGKTYRIDVVGISEQLAVAVECGKITGGPEYKEQKLEFLNSHFDVYRHLSYLHTKKSRSVDGYIAPEVDLSGEDPSFTSKTCRANKDGSKQVTVPKRLCRNEDIEPGDVVTFRIVKVEKHGERDV